MTLKYIFDRFSSYSNALKISKTKLWAMYICDFIRFRCTIRDFFNYKFYLLNTKGKSCFLTGRKLKVMFDKINLPEQEEYLISKEKTFLKYVKYMNRMWCGVNYNNTLEHFNDFIKSNDACVFKPLDACGGHGIKLIDLEHENAYTAEVLQKECFENNAIIEALIPQHDEMKILNKSSLNTIRIITVNNEILGAVLRMGRDDNFVDNACSGGIFAEVDVETGIVISKAISYDGKTFIIHPDSNAQIVGFKIPLWDKCIAIVKDSIGILPEIPIKGFDVAITPDKPVFVEVNERPELALLQQPNALHITESMLNIKRIVKENKR